MRVVRQGLGPIISPDTCDSIGANIQGPSLIVAPPWIDEPLGSYYLYFADHKGGHIRLAYSDRIDGDWTVYRPGALQLADSCFLTEPPSATDDELAELRDAYRRYFGTEYSIDEVLVDAVTPHIASPDVHLDHANERVVMYFHGLESLGTQVTRVATSSDGIKFTAQPQVLGRSYFRVFEYGGWFYALVMPGQLLRSRDGFTNFEPGPKLFEPEMRHSAVMVRGDMLDVFWTRVGDAPESILWSQIDLTSPWEGWTEGPTTVVLAPERPWEGADAAAEPSRRSAVHGLVNQLRDPAIFVDSDEVHLLYAAGGESCIGLAKVEILV